MSVRPGHVALAAVVTLATAVAGSLVLFTGPASTVERTVGDRRHDVWAWTPTSGGRGHFTATGAQVNVDLVAVEVRHRLREVVVKAAYVDLRATGPGYGLTVDLRTDQHLGRHASFVAGRGDHWLGHTQVLDSRQRKLRCTRRHTDVSYRRDAVWITVLRGCLQNPRWVQFRAMAFTVVGKGALRVDTAHNARPTFTGWSRRIPRA